MNAQESLTEDDIQAWARLVRVSQSLLARVEADVKAAGFPPLSWYDALLELRRAGDAGLRPFELQEEMLLAQYNLSRLIERLANAGYVERHPAADDKRGHIVRITPEGQALLREMWPVYREALRRYFAARLSEADIRALSGIMTKLN